MRKLLVLFLALAFIGGLLCVSKPGKAGVAGAVLDQSFEQVAGSGSTIVDGWADRYQVFTPTKNHVVSIDVFLKNRKPGSIVNVTLINDSNLAFVAHGQASNQLTMGGNGWETLPFTEPFPEVIPGSAFRMRLSINDNQTQWALNNGGYAGGYFSLNHSEDALFREYGRDEDTGTPATNIENPSQTQPAQATVDPSIPFPVLSYLVKTEKHINAPIKDTLEVSTKDTLQAFGTSFAGSHVVLFLNDKAVAATTDANGNWNYTFDMASFKTNEIVTVKAQAQNDQGAGSNIVELFKFKKVPKKILFMSVGEDFAIPYWIYLAFAGAILAIIILYLISRAKKKGTESASAAPKIPERKKLGSGK